LIAVFSDTFGTLSPPIVDLHIASLLLIALAIALIITPAAYHRISEPGWISRSFCRRASKLIAAAIVVMSMGLCLEIYVVVRASTQSELVSKMLAVGAMLVFAAFWVVYPLGSRFKRKRRAPHET
jgi:hypothetical protein